MMPMAMLTRANSTCERFHKIILNEFYPITFKTKRYEKIKELQNILING